MYNKLNERTDVSPNCTFGCIENETIEYLLFHCPYAKSVWASEPSPLNINFDNSKKFLDICKHWLENDNPIVPLEIILTKVWFIWKERCNRSFEKTEQTYSQLALEIQRHLSFWYKDSYQEKDTSTRFKEKPIWDAPSHDQKKLNIDAVWTSVNEPSSFSLILRNDAGKFVQGRAGSISATSPEEAEALGLLHASAWAVEEGLTNFSVEGDCKNLFDYRNGKPSQITWKNQKIMNEVKRDFNLCQHFLGFFYVPRLANNVVDILAKEAKLYSTFVDWRDVPPPCIVQALEVDKSNVRVEPLG
ncbi:uncharacterized protein LOC113360661 [Papaver somniferum]|uniref:uncharacterized protein LOC113360661 n=1 Tax=Papaver somniferum TaxID=3469 RepID=UPI000E70333C|nr:uncharacterized protein LOC113360661 [Papaver somniferum]